MLDLDLLGQFLVIFETFCFLCSWAFLIVFALFVRKNGKYKPSIKSVFTMLFVVLLSLLSLTLMQKKHNTMIRLEFKQLLSKGTDGYLVKINRKPVLSSKLIPLLLTVEDKFTLGRGANKRVRYTLEIYGPNHQKLFLNIYQSYKKKNEWFIFSKKRRTSYSKSRFIGIIKDKKGILNETN